jgi:hypothetical protein
VNLRFAERLIAGDPLFTRLRDLLGLTLALAALAVASAAGAGLARLPAVARLVRLDGVATSVALLAGALGGWALLGVALSLDELPISRPQWALAAALVGAALIGGTALVLRRNGAPRPWSLGAIGASTLLPAFGVASLAAATARGLLVGPGDALRSFATSGALFVVVALVARIACAPGRARSAIVRGCTLAVLLSAGAAAAAGCLATLRCGASTGTPLTTRASTARPNVVLVVLDTVRADHLRRYGYARDTMPALERWAERALVAERAVSPAGWTSPAHASLFSGLTPSQHGIDYAIDPADGLRTRARDGIRWLPDRLAAAGYTTLAVVANELALPAEVTGFARRLAPRRDGWNGATLGHVADALLPPLRWASEAIGWRLPYVDAEGIVDVALRALPEGGPLFLFVNFMDAHSPYDPPPSALRALGVAPGHVIDRYLSHRDLTKRWPRLPAGAAAELADLYDAKLRFLDGELARLLDAVAARLGPETVVVVTSDHGEELGEEGRVGHEFGLSQALIHVPLFVRAPGLDAGTVAEPVSLRNLFGFIARVGEGGGAARSELTRDDGSGVLSERSRSLYNIYHLGRGYDRAWVAGFEGALKAVGPTEDGFALLDVGSAGFDRELPAADGPAGAALRERIDRYWNAFRDRRKSGGAAPLSAEVEARLRALGYGR